MIFNPERREAHQQFLLIYNSFLISRFQMNCFHGSPCRRPHSAFLRGFSLWHQPIDKWLLKTWQVTVTSLCILQEKTSMDPISPPPPGGTQLIPQCPDCKACCWDRIWKPESRNHSKVHFHLIVQWKSPAAALPRFPSDLFTSNTPFATPLCPETSTSTTKPTGGIE